MVSVTERYEKIKTWVRVCAVESMPRRAYSDDDRVRALLALAANGGNLPRTAYETGIPERTIRHWKDGDRHPESAQLAEEKKLPLADEAEAVARLLLGDCWDAAKRKRASLKDTATAFGILTDKTQLLRGKPTSINQHDLDGLTDDELDRRRAEAQRMLALGEEVGRQDCGGTGETEGEAASP